MRRSSTGSVRPASPSTGREKQKPIDREDRFRVGFEEKEVIACSTWHHRKPHISLVGKMLSMR
ncbi:hypothetical protein SBA6_740024 [Candidatus Sulfopaludibacter sp. SbA6]|nr:hypothetical protein SBA6_740024 [Candidatus Sulfopaludibacter sp. SbA6]